MTITATYFGTSTVTTVGSIGVTLGVAVGDTVEWGFDISIDPATSTSVTTSNLNGSYFTEANGQSNSTKWDPEDAVRFAIKGVQNFGFVKDGKDNIDTITLTVDSATGKEIDGGKIIFTAYTPGTGSATVQVASIELDFDNSTFEIWYGPVYNKGITTIGSGTISGKTLARLPASPSNSTSGSPYGTSRSLTGPMTSPMTLNITQ